MGRRILTAIVIALFLVQNLVFCCGHVHPSGTDIAQCRPHLHFHGHAHERGHCHHEGDHQPTEMPPETGHDHHHNCVLDALKQDAIIQNPELVQHGFEFFELAGQLHGFFSKSVQSDLSSRPSKHLYWLQSSAIHLQVCALLI